MAATQFKTVSINATQGRVASRSRAAPRVVAALPSFKQVATTVGTAAASLALAISANAATVKLGADNGESDCAFEQVHTSSTSRSPLIAIHRVTWNDVVGGTLSDLPAS